MLKTERELNPIEISDLDLWFPCQDPCVELQLVQGGFRATNIHKESDSLLNKSVDESNNMIDSFYYYKPLQTCIVKPFHQSQHSVAKPSVDLIDLSTGRSVVGANVLACLAVGAGSDGGGDTLLVADQDGVGSGCCIMLAQGTYRRIPSTHVQHRSWSRRECSQRRQGRRRERQGRQ